MFKEDGYEVVRNVLSSTTLQFVSESIGLLRKRNQLKYNDSQVEKAYAAYGNPISERLLQSLRPAVSRVTSYPLLPAYSYLRVYLRGAVLAKHVDRPSCEISTTVAISYDAPALWPLYLEAKGEVVRVELNPGDMLVYRGPDLPHWRTAFDGEKQIQIFLHYVREDGPYKDLKFDRREHLGLPAPK